MTRANKQMNAPSAKPPAGIRRSAGASGPGAYEAIKKRIVFCELMPGSPLAEEELAAGLGLSRTPIREALMRLARERLVEVYPRKGTFVAGLSLQDIYEVFQLRMILEPQAARIGYPAMDPAELREFRRAFRKVRPETDQHVVNDLSLDRRLHEFIVGSTRNRYLAEVYASMFDLNLRIGFLTGKHTPTRIREGVAEHLALIDALLSRDEDAIVSAVTAHIVRSRDAALTLDAFARH